MELLLRVLTSADGGVERALFSRAAPRTRCHPRSSSQDADRPLQQGRRGPGLVCSPPPWVPRCSPRAAGRARRCCGRRGALAREADYHVGGLVVGSRDWHQHTKGAQPPPPGRPARLLGRSGSPSDISGRPPVSAQEPAAAWRRGCPRCRPGGPLRPVLRAPQARPMAMWIVSQIAASAASSPPAAAR